MRKVAIPLVAFIILYVHPHLFSQEHSWQSLYDSTNAYMQKQDFQTALDWGQKALVQAEKEFGKLDTNYIKILTSLSGCIFYLGKYDIAIDYTLNAIELIREVYGEKSSEYSDNLSNLGLFYIFIHQFELAEPKLIESLKIMRELYPEDHPNIANVIGNLGLTYKSKGDYEKAKEYSFEALKMLRKLYKNDHFQLAFSINNLAGILKSLSEFQEAEKFYNEALSMRRRIYKSDHPELSNSLNDIALFYHTIGKYTEAEAYYKEALAMNNRLYKGNHRSIAVNLNNLAYFYSETGRLEQVEEYLLQALHTFDMVFKKENPESAYTLNNLGSYYVKTGNLKNAEEAFKKSLQISRSLYKTDHPYLAMSIFHLASFYNSTNNLDQAQPLMIEANEMRKRIFKTDHPAKVNSLNNLALLYLRKGEIDKALLLDEEAYSMGKRLYISDHKDIAMILNNLSQVNQILVNNEVALEQSLESMRIYKKLFEENNLTTITSHNNIAKLYSALGEYEKSEFHFNVVVKSIKNLVHQLFRSFSENEKKKFWNTIKDPFNVFNSFGVKRAVENPKILIDMYDNHLFTKGLLFNSTSKVKSRILNSGDSVLINKYYNWSDKKEFLVNLYSMPSEEVKKKGFDIDSIENIATDLEKELTLKSEDFKKAYEKKKVTWKHIQFQLLPDEAAVEVIRFRKRGKVPNEYNPEVMIDGFTDTICYAFLIVSEKTEENPELVLLENGKELENDFYNMYRNMMKKKLPDTESYARYWSKLHEKLKGYKKIYFSADGIYNKLNPATLQMPDGKFIFDMYDIQQLNSTKDIILGFYETKQESNIYNSAVLIGNPNFSLGEEEVKVASARIRSEAEEIEIWEPMASTRGIKLTKLPGTEKEIKDVELFLQSRKWDVKTYLGDMALKAAVKEANNPRVLHIATHGMFLEDVKRDRAEMFGFDQQKMVENPLLRSGLFFTGADNYIEAEDKPTGDDNGVLTAYEAMNLNLDKTELVVLSACETGLGEVQNGEGVFGLRRAFQTAGAKTVVMSLWTVSDQATQELMSNFYSNWITGMTKREAFNKAQQSIKDKYKDPYYWGAFVMVGE